VWPKRDDRQTQGVTFLEPVRSLQVACRAACKQHVRALSFADGTDVLPGDDQIREFNMMRLAFGRSVVKELDPDIIEVQFFVGSPAESFKRLSAGLVEPGIGSPGTGWKTRPPVPYFHAVMPNL